MTSSPLTASPRLQPQYQAPSSSSRPHASPPSSARPQQRVSRAQNGGIREDKFKLLQKYDTVLLIDDSGSMWRSLWSDVENLLAQLAPIITKYDNDGIDLYFLNHETEDRAEGRAIGGYFGITDQLEDEPDGGTLIRDRLEVILRAYLDYYEKKLKLEQQRDVKPLNIIVITDGDADDDVEGVIVWAAKKLDQYGATLNQVGIQFFQIGDDEKARAELNRLDSKLKGKHGIRDMVDTVSWDEWDPNDPEKGPSLSADSILKVVLGAVNRKLDRGGEQSD